MELASHFEAASTSKKSYILLDCIKKLNSDMGHTSKKKLAGTWKTPPVQRKF
jgi:hypothetical protein